MYNKDVHEMWLQKGGEIMNRSKIAETLISLRGEKSREEVANALNIAVSTLAMYELGQRVPRDEIKLKLADYYGVDVQSIFFD